ncbi:hypothetical protein LEN26_016053 [Aphanomyces euteiches]|nr:hypothetical protein LEN26_016053 [Aphanomyces euteiches]
MTAPPTKAVIRDSFHGASTRRTYATYQKQFVQFCNEKQNGMCALSATTDVCTDFFHELYTSGKKARTVDAAKTSLVSFFKDNNVHPNPAQDAEAKKYVIGSQKSNRQNNVDEERKAHPLTVNELSTLMNCFGEERPFVCSMLQLLFCCCFLGRFRIGEVLALRWNDIAFGADDGGKYLSVRLRWHKKASVEKESQIYHLVDEISFPCLRVCSMYQAYLTNVTATSINVSKEAFLFPSYKVQQHGLKLDWYKPLEQGFVRRMLYTTVDRAPTLPIGILLHSMRRGGCFFRVFESTERRFNFRELMAWCRWSDKKTCCDYLVTKSISDEIDSRNLLRIRASASCESNGMCSLINIDALVDRIKAILHEELELARYSINSNQRNRRDDLAPSKLRQSTMQEQFLSKGVPTANSGKTAWDQWFTPNPKIGLHRALKDYTKEMIKTDRKKYSERHTLALAFTKYQDFDQFETAYVGHTHNYSTLLKEVRKRKREGRL